MLTDEQLMRSLMRAMARARRQPPRGAPGERRLPFGKGFGHILDLLVERDGVSQQQLADAVGIRPQSVSEAIATMENHGFVRREPSAADRRVMLIYVTEQGREYHEKVSEERRIHAKKYFSALEESEKQALFALLEKLIQSNDVKKNTETEAM